MASHSFAGAGKLVMLLLLLASTSFEGAAKLVVVPLLLHFASCCVRWLVTHELLQDYEL